MTGSEGDGFHTPLQPALENRWKSSPPPTESKFNGGGGTDIAIYDVTDAEFFILYSDGESLVMTFGNKNHSNTPI